MPDCQLRFARVSAGRDAQGSVHIYYGSYYVGAISHSGGSWTARLHDIPLGRFDDVGSAMRVVGEWYYGSEAMLTAEPERSGQDQK